VSMGRPQHIAMGRPGQHDVAHIAPLTANKPRVLEPGDRLTYAEFAHERLLVVLLPYGQPLRPPHAIALRTRPVQG